MSEPDGRITLDTNEKGHVHLTEHNHPLAPYFIGSGTLTHPRDMIRALETLEAVEYAYIVDGDTISEGEATLVKLMADSGSATMAVNGCLFLNVSSFRYLDFSTDDEGLCAIELAWRRLDPLATLAERGRWGYRCARPAQAARRGGVRPRVLRRRTRTKRTSSRSCSAATSGSGRDGGPGLEFGAQQLDRLLELRVRFLFRLSFRVHLNDRCRERHLHRRSRALSASGSARS